MQTKVINYRRIGMSYKQIAGALKISQSTVKYHLFVVFAKTGAHSTIEAIYLAGLS